MKRATLLVAGALAMTASSGGEAATPVPAPPPTAAPISFPNAPSAPTGPNDAATASLDAILDSIPLGLSVGQIQNFIDVGDAGHAWLLSDLLRFAGLGAETPTMVGGFATLTGADISDEVPANRSAWNVVTNHLIAWDTPAPPALTIDAASAWLSRHGPVDQAREVRASDVGDRSGAGVDPVVVAGGEADVRS